MRLFVALPLPEVVCRKIGEIQETLRQRLPSRSIRWTNPRQAHLTLCFLGEVQADQLDALKSRLAKVTPQTQPLTLGLSAVGCFPRPQAPRVLWVGLNGELDQLNHLQISVASACRQWCEKDELNPFHPHLTIARIKEHVPRLEQNLYGLLGNLSENDSPSWMASNFILMQSRLLAAGPEYHEAGRFTLGPESASAIT
ncbi:MAG TPA: RNA 2',3'-cyclic phosphodiesterase [Candidatus Paceibacterota bacterium]|nr:RNA 2',3'-cyclic phosphodiesterase [Candidatus Paceibacterota bacterium]